MNPLQSLGLIFGLSSVLILSACSSGSSDSAATTDSGTLEIAITDAEEDFLTYQITLDSVTLNRRDGSRVDVLPLSTEVDFVQYQDLTELFAVASIPAGRYESITLRLDYSDADIVIQDEEGTSYNATAIDSDGEVLTEIEVELTFAHDRPVIITPKRTAQLTLDLDLAASNTIESFEPALVTVEPFMLASAELDDEREHRVRGLLIDADEQTSLVTLNVRPMRHRRGQFGEFTFAVNDDTRYEINGEEYSGEAGLAQMAALAEDSPVVAYGYNDRDDDAPYQAETVIAGTSVPWNNDDVLKGIIAARSDNTLTIKGAVIEAAATKAHFRQTIELSVGDDSLVTGYRLGDADIANLSVGQGILALGDYNQETGSFDATEGVVRMKLNRLVGEVTQVSPLQLDLSHINRRPVEVFNFSGTGLDADNDANPSAYEVDTSDLDLSSIETEEWLQVRGYPTAFGGAPMDFDAISILNPDFSSHPAKLHAHWDKDSENPISIENELLLLNSEGARIKLHLVGVPGSVALALNVDYIAGTDEPGLYAIKARSKGVHLYRNFAEFVQAAQDLKEKGLAAKHMTAAGQYREADQSLRASRVTLFMKPKK